MAAPTEAAAAAAAGIEVDSGSGGGAQRSSDGAQRSSDGGRIDGHAADRRCVRRPALLKCSTPAQDLTDVNIWWLKSISVIMCVHGSTR